MKPLALPPKEQNYPQIVRTINRCAHNKNKIELKFRHGLKTTKSCMLMSNESCGMLGIKGVPPSH